ncbi:MAG: hypothetical protein L0Y39_04050 [Methylococcaceae bacterium]|nr:hypothetical protein [Methylococcaceae bacterium]
MLAPDRLLFGKGPISARLINNQQVMIMDTYDYPTETNESMKVGKYQFLDDIPEPIGQWEVADYHQFASLIVDAE